MENEKSEILTSLCHLVTTVAEAVILGLPRNFSKIFHGRCLAHTHLFVCRKCTIILETVRRKKNETRDVTCKLL